MNTISKDILENYQIRNRKKQKTRFIEMLSPALENAGYSVSIEESRGIAYSRNIVVGNPASAKYIFCAHYDTPAVLPFPNFLTPKNMLIFLIYQLVIAFVLIVPAAVVGLAVLYFTQNILMAQLGWLIMLALMMYLLIAGKPNKNNANDNTSGVITLVESAISMPKNLRNNVAYIFFDNEEKGMLGSSAYSSAHKKHLSQKTVINFDCVSDGDEIYIVPKGSAKKDKALFKALDSAFLPVDGKKVVLEKGFFLYPSDQMSFRKSVAVCAMKRSKILGLYVNRIHTSRDTVLDNKNIELLRLGMQKLIEQ